MHSVRNVGNDDLNYVCQLLAWWESAEFKFRKKQNVQNKQLFRKLWKYCKSHIDSVRNVENDDLNYVCYS